MGKIYLNELDKAWEELVESVNQIRGQEITGSHEKNHEHQHCRAALPH
ncbi:MAG: hypothetical protein MZV63_50960 [Marinilabiliales bacterium]|nr:hypothetical protein [Marinilabiliales bacterium]